jgi:hypothetical protein
MDQFEIELNPPKVEDNQFQAPIDFSIKVVEVLTGKVKDHNLTAGKKINLSQLKKVYIKGASLDQEEGKTKGESAMARVNMFLRLTSDDFFKSSLKKGKSNSSSLKNAEIDLTEDWAASEEDFAKASEDIIKYNLDYNFANVEDLYLDENRSGFSFEV